MRLFLTLTATLVLMLLAASSAEPACCYFSALEKDVNQPGQKVFLTWDPVEKVESFTVQPMFEGNATSFGMVIPTPAQPKLDEMHRDLFKSLAVFTILKPMNVRKFKPMRLRRATKSGGGSASPGAQAERDSGVRVLEAGVVGSLDYKIIEATKPDGLYEWLSENGYQYSGDKQTLGFYIQKKWFFTVMKIDPKQMKRRTDGTYLGEVTPTRFTFESERLVYPLRITRISVKKTTDALFYIQAPQKMDLPGELSHQLSFQSMWTNAYSFANWDHCTDAEKAWWAFARDQRQWLAQEVNKWRREKPGRKLTTLEWARRLTPEDMQVLTGERAFDRKAPAADVKQLATLRGILQRGQFVTKCRHIFHKDEMGDDLVFAEAKFRGRNDGVEHIEILPNSPP
ncbi:MAG: DUF2330 domain-containing protein [bacterium]|nr:DUF2330 domain-containing protein [bacterium]